MKRNPNRILNSNIMKTGSREDKFYEYLRYLNHFQKEELLDMLMSRGGEFGCNMCGNLSPTIVCEGCECILAEVSEEESFYEDWKDNYIYSNIETIQNKIVSTTLDQNPLICVLNAISVAKHSIHIAMYTFTSESVTTELVKGYRRGVNISVIVDKNQAENYYSYKILSQLENCGIEVYRASPKIITKYSCMHHKFMIVDEELVLHGSFNYTYSASEHNDEVLFVENDNIKIQTFVNIWKRLYARTQT